MKRIGCGVILLLFLILLFTGGCADEKSFVKVDSYGNSKTFIAEPYGWANDDAKKKDGVVYQLSAGNIIWSIILCETIVIPVYLTGWKIYEPVRLETDE